VRKVTVTMKVKVCKSRPDTAALHVGVCLGPGIMYILHIMSPHLKRGMVV
jgi:hypothetical protein